MTAALARSRSPRYKHFLKKDCRYDVAPLPVKHRKAPAYRPLSYVRAVNMTWALEEAGIVPEQDHNRVRDFIHDALDDARSAGFAAGVAWARSKGGRK